MQWSTNSFGFFLLHCEATFDNARLFGHFFLTLLWTGRKRSLASFFLSYNLTLDPYLDFVTITRHDKDGIDFFTLIVFFWRQVFFFRPWLNSKYFRFFFLQIFYVYKITEQFKAALLKCSKIFLLKIFCLKKDS